MSQTSFWGNAEPRRALYQGLVGSHLYFGD